MMIKLEDINPYVRAAEIQPTVLEGDGIRIAYDYRLFYILEVKSKNASIVFENEEIMLENNSILIIKPGEGYYFRGKLRVVVLNFDATRICKHRTLAVCPPPANLFDNSRKFDETIISDFTSKFIVQGNELLKECSIEIVKSFTTKSDYSDALCSALLKQLLCEILQKRNGLKDSLDTLTDRIYSYIRMNIGETIDNQKLGQVFGYHPVYIAEVFKNKTGKTLHSIILSERINLASRYLEQTSESIEQIAFYTGFSSRSHFCTAFKKITTQTPREYRRISQDPNI